MKETIDTLEKQGWKFHIGYSTPLIEFKSPRLNSFHYFYAEYFTLEELLKYEQECVLVERLHLLDNLYDVAKKKLIHEWNLIIKKNQPLPKEISLDFNFKNE